MWEKGWWKARRAEYAMVIVFVEVTCGRKVIGGGVGGAGGFFFCKWRVAQGTDAEAHGEGEGSRRAVSRKPGGAEAGEEAEEKKERNPAERQGARRGDGNGIETVGKARGERGLAGRRGDQGTRSP